MRTGLKTMTEDVIRDARILVKIQNIVRKQVGDARFEDMSLDDMLAYYNSNALFELREKRK